MTDKKSSESRRKLLKSIAAGSGAIVAGKSLPDTWSRPVVDSVMLPAHAQTSALTYFTDNLMAENNGQQHGESTLFARFSNHLIPEAHAQPRPPGVGCAKVVGSMLEFEIWDLSYTLSGMLPLDKSVVNATYQDCSGSNPEPMQIIYISTEKVVIATTEPVFTLPVAPGCGVVPGLVC